MKLHNIFYLLGMVGDALRTEEAAAVGSDEQVVLNTDASEVLVGVEKVEVEELLAVALRAPEVDEVGDEVDTWLVGDDEALLQPSAHAQAVGAELLKVRTRLLVEAHVNLPQAFHVVHVHTHHVAKSVRQEHRMRPCAYSFFSITLHQAELLQTVGHQAADGKVHVGILHTRLGHLEHIVVAGLDDGVDLQLTLRETSVDGHRARIV